MTDSPRSQEIAQARQQRETLRANETQIMQKVNLAHREAFLQKFPGQIEHCMRLITERLQLGLRKDQVMPISNHEVEQLAQAIWCLYQVHLAQQD